MLRAPLVSISLACIAGIAAASVCVAQGPWHPIDSTGLLRARGSAPPVRTIESHRSENHLASASAGEWISNIGNPGIQSVIVDAIMIDSNDVYVGGRFAAPGSSEAASLAVWNRVTRTWTTFPGDFNGVIRAIVRFGDELVVGGDFTSVDGRPLAYVARFNGAAWSAVGEGFNGPVLDLLVEDNRLFAGGEFDESDGANVTAIAVLHNDEWFGVSDGLFGRVTSLAASNGSIYAAGDFSVLGSSNIAELRDGQWRALGGGLSASVLDVEVFNGKLYAAGHFYFADEVRVNGLARWNGAAWEAVGSADNAGVVQSLASNGTHLFAAGAFTFLAGVRADGIARWDGASWQSIGSLNGNMTALAVDGEDVFTGGQITRADDVDVSGITHFNGSAWTSLGEGLRSSRFVGRVSSFAHIGDEVFVGGSFTSAGGIPALNIASWNRRTNTWSSLGSGVNADVLSMAVYNDRLAVAGKFTLADGTSANHIADFDPLSREWTSYGSGIRPEVLDVAVVGSSLYFGTYGVARWNGSSIGFSTTGPEGWVSAVEDFGGELYAGGEFSVSGGTETRGIARLGIDGWRAVDRGLYGSVYDMTVHDDELIVAGLFDPAGASALFSVGRWNGERWASAGLPPDGPVMTVRSSGDVLYAGGYFDNAGGNPASNVARWSNAEWSPLGGGTDRGVTSLQPVGDQLIVGGDFYQAGGLPVTKIAVWSSTTSSIVVARVAEPTSLSVNPNPTSGTFVISAPNNTVRVELVDALGRIASTMRPQTSDDTAMTLDCEHLPVGRYTLRCITPSGVVSRAAVIAR